jgi:UDP-glucuronate decarboxylase
MRILVAGGAGFVGSHLCTRLVHEGHFVYCLDDLSTGRMENIEPLTRSPRFSFVPRSVLDPVWLPVDAIYNLASPAPPPHDHAAPEHTLWTNVEGTRALLQLAEETGSHLIYASSGGIYGDPAQHPQQEDYVGNVKTMGPRACYDEGKRCAETLCYLYRERGVPVSVVRIFNTYGPRMRSDDGRAVSNLLTQALHDRPLTIFGDGRQTRSFCYVDDLVEALARLLPLEKGLPGPVNLGNPDERSVVELAELILRLTGSRSEITFAPLPQGDPVRRCPDISLARRLLGWAPATPLEQGLAKTMRHFRRTLNVGRPVLAASAAIVA